MKMTNNHIVAMSAVLSGIIAQLLIVLFIQAIWNYGLAREFSELPQISYLGTLAAYCIIKLTQSQVNTKKDT